MSVESLNLSLRLATAVSKIISLDCSKDEIENNLNEAIEKIVSNLYANGSLKEEDKNRWLEEFHFEDCNLETLLKSENVKEQIIEFIMQIENL